MISQSFTRVRRSRGQQYSRNCEIKLIGLAQSRLSSCCSMNQCTCMELGMVKAQNHFSFGFDIEYSFFPPIGNMTHRTTQNNHVNKMQIWHRSLYKCIHAFDLCVRTSFRVANQEFSFVLLTVITNLIDQFGSLHCYLVTAAAWFLEKKRGTKRKTGSWTWEYDSKETPSWLALSIIVNRKLCTLLFSCQLSLSR